MRGRIRTVKPEFYQHSGLYDAEVEFSLPLRLAYEGLWNYSDREGLFEWKPRELKLNILPYDPVDFARVLDALATRGFVVRYACRGREYGWIPTFKEHQIINNREEASKIPPPPPDVVSAVDNHTYRYDSRAWVTREPRVDDASGTREARGSDAALGEGNGRDGKGTELKGSNAVPSEPSCARTEEPAAVEPPAGPKPVPPDEPDMTHGDYMSAMRKVCGSKREPITEPEMAKAGSITKRFLDRGWRREQIYKAAVGWRAMIDRGEVSHIPAGSKFSLAKLYDKDPTVDPVQIGLDAYHGNMSKPPPGERRKSGQPEQVDPMDIVKRFSKGQVDGSQNSAA
jgi:hypothetical protein